MAPAAGLPDDASKADVVHRQLRAEIESGALPPGTPLTELALVERMGASRTPIREALRRLAAEGLADLVPRQGARVSRVSLRNVRDLFDFRTLLEPQAMRQTAEAVPGDRELHGTLIRLRGAFTGIQGRGPSPARSAAFYELADRFDWTVIGATGNQHLRRTIAELRPHTARLRNLSHGDPGRLEVSLVEHLRMCDALIAGDGDEAAASCTEHLTQSLRTIYATLAAGDGLDGLDALQ